MSASSPSFASATPTWLLLTPFDKPPEPPVPIKLNELAGSTVPLMSSAVLPVPLKLPATIVFLRRTVPPETMIPPPEPMVSASESALLSVIVLLVIVIVPPSTEIPPPLAVALLPLIVVLMSVAVPVVAIAPPSPRSAVLPFKVELTTVSVPSFRIAPPLPVFRPLLTVSRTIEKLKPVLTLNTRVLLAPLIVTAFAAKAGPTIVRFLLMTSSPVSSVMVCGVENAPAVSKVSTAPSQAFSMILRSVPADPSSAALVTRVAPQTAWAALSELPLLLASPL